MVGCYESKHIKQSHAAINLKGISHYWFSNVLANALATAHGLQTEPVHMGHLAELVRMPNYR